jgi:hypothetical protein
MLAAPASTANPTLRSAFDALSRPRLYDLARVMGAGVRESTAPDRVCSEQLYVFPLHANTPFAVLQSRVHELWARLLSSSMKTDLRCAASVRFETFPFPQPDPRSVIPELEALGEKLYAARAAYMLDTNQGVNKTYNALKDATCTDECILELRALHEEMDRAVLDADPLLPAIVVQAVQAGAAPKALLAPLIDSPETNSSADAGIVGWSGIPVPPFCIVTEADRAALHAFEDEVIDRLFVLNELRAKKGKLQGNKPGKGAGKKQTKKVTTKGKGAQPTLLDLGVDTDEKDAGQDE